MIKIINNKIGKLVLFILIPFSVYSQDVPNNKFEFALSGGYLLSGKVYAAYHSDFDPDSTVTIRNSASPLLKLVADYNLNSKLSIGVNINYAKFNIDDILYKGESMKTGNEVSLGTWDGREHIIPLDDIKMLELNASIKWRFILSDKMVLKPCLYLGYRKTFSGSPDAEEQGVVINYNLEYQYYLYKKSFILVDLGFFSQPYGGVDNVGYVKTLGVPYFTIGYGFAIE